LTGGTEYDGKSVMHYPAGNKMTSLRTDLFLTSEIGKSDWMTATDELEIRRMYGCEESGVTTTTPPPSSCGIPDDKGDGWCDDVNNNAGCNWDDGDCCPPNSIENPNWNGACSKCKCLDPNAGGSTTTPFTTTTKATTTPFTTTTKTTTTSSSTDGCGSPEYATDSWCDDGNNNDGCNWDDGACCGDNVDKEYCTLCECRDPNAGI